MDLNAKENQLVNRLQRALFYESQYRNAIVSDSMSFYDVNISKDLIENDFFYRGEDGQFFSVPEYVGMHTPCKFSSFIERWVDAMIPASAREKYPFLPDLNNRLLNTFNEGKRDLVIEYWADNSKGKKIYINQRFLLTKNEDGDVCALAIVKDFTKHRTLEEMEHRKELEYFAFVDPITKGHNYIKFKQLLRSTKKDGAIVSVDIHSFKIINSICGIARGDQVIAAIWQCIVNALEFEDGDLAGHINADHFVIFINNTDKDVIIGKLKCITFALNLISSEMTDVPQIKPYYGIAIWHPMEKVEYTYNHAIAAKHKARDDNNQNYSFFDEKDTLKMIREKELVDSFETAMAKKEFKVWYQPKYKPISKELVGAEALVRWQKSDGSIIPPGEFIPLFERNGMIHVLDEYIFRNVCIQQKKWQLMNKGIVPVSINLSRASLYYKNVVNQYKRIVEEVNLDTQMVPIEITESAAINNDTIHDVVEAFHESGFKLHMDDFGSGYSSLASLNQMHFETLKLDKSLIDFIGNFGGDRLLEHTICLAKELGMHVTAEGVEEEKQVLFLKHTGCDSIQGYFYSKPISQEIYEKLLEEQKNKQKFHHIDYVAEKIVAFKQSILKPPLYSCLVNLSKNVYSEEVGSYSLSEETGISGTDYDVCINLLAERYILPESKNSYLSFMDRKTIIDSFNGYDQTRFYQYGRFFKGKPCLMQMMSYVFSVKESSDVWMFFNVAMIDEIKRN